MAVSAVWRLVSPLTAYPSEPRSRPKHTGETRCAPLLKSKSKRLLVLFVTDLIFEVDRQSDHI